MIGGINIKILAIVGSLRKDSYNRQLAKEAEKILINMDVEFEILDYKSIPIFNQDIENPELENIRQVREKVDSADGIWFFTPEYNRSYPGVLKNLIDWLSRPIEWKKGSILANKPVAVSGITLGMTGTLLSQEHLYTLISTLNMKVMNAPRLAIPNAKEQMDENGNIKLTKSYKYLERQATSFVNFIGNEK